MPNSFTSNTFASTYKDDFSDSAGYQRILFNSGRALQARELTQLQTITQTEMSRLGGHFFKEGASVSSGSPTVNNQYEFIKLDTSVNALSSTDATNIVGVNLTSDSGIIVNVIEATVATDTDPATLFVAYVDTSSGSSGANPIRVAAGEDLSGGGFTFTVQATNTTSNPAIGVGTRFSTHGGEYFAQGRIVFAAAQNLIISKYTSNPTVNVGFKVIEDIVTVSDTDALYDNQGATPNVASPGADRYRIRLTLIDQANVDSDENFIQIAQVVRGSIQSSVASPTGEQYNKLGDVLAMRTKEESGNYIVDPFILTFANNDSDNTKLDFKIDPGTAYVNGYRVSKTVETVLPVNKPRTTITNNNDVTAAGYGNYYVVSGNKGIPNINTFEQFDLRDTVGYGGSTIGTARVRAVEEDGANWRIYMFNFQMNAGSNERSVKSIGTSVTNYWNVVLENSQAKRKDAGDDGLLFGLPESRPQAISDISLTVQRYFSTSTNGSGQASLNLSASGETFADTNLWVTGASDSDTEVVTVSGAGTSSVSVSGAAASQGTYEILGYVNKSAGTIRTKTLNETTETIAVDSDGSGNAFYQLTNPDIYSFDRLRDSDSDGADIAGIVTTDDGQRASFYDRGRLDVIKGNTAPSNAFVRYKYFSHGAAGDFFAVNSYTGQVEYENIPSFTDDDGNSFPLREVLDFRSVVNTSGNFGSGAIINEVPRNTDTVQFDANYYLGKNAKLIASDDGTLSVIQGNPALNPKMPATPPNALELYKIELAPYVLSPSDLAVTRSEAKRYTMEEIGKLEQRLESLEEATAMTMLELKTSTFTVLDETGAIRTKSGFYVDNFADQRRSATNNAEYRASIDPSRKLMRPSFNEKAVGMKFDSTDAATSNVIQKGDNLYLNYTESSYIVNDSMTGTENVNPFAVVKGIGLMTISPASDSWRETRRLADKVIQGDDQFNVDQNQLWDNWNWNWSGNETVGTSLGQQQTGDSTQWGRTTRGDVISQSDRNIRRGRSTFRETTTTFETTQTGVRTINTAAAVVTGFSTINETIGDRVVSRTLIPKMRSQKIFFKAEGLRPNTRFFPFFGGKNVSTFCREETFAFASSTDSDFSTGYENITTHPETSSNLVSDAQGTIEGSFFLPSTDDDNFNTGEREFKLLDISVNKDEDALSRAKTSYVSTGTLITRQRDVLATRTVHIGTEESTTTSTVTQAGQNETVTSEEFLFREQRERLRAGRQFNLDPLAQTFMVDEVTGVFLTGVKLRFKSKSTKNVPVVVEIRPTVNGYPSAQEHLPGSTVFKAPAAVSISDDGSNITTFTFDEPVFCQGLTEYSIVVISDSDEYNLYVAKVGEFILGSTEKKLRRQSNLGVLFKSQNARTWEPDQLTDMTFELMRAEFDTSGAAIFNNRNLPFQVLPANSISVTNSSGTVTVAVNDHGFDVGDVVQIADATAVGGIAAANINGNRTVTAKDGTGFQFTAGSSDTASSTTTGGGRPKIENQFNYNVAVLKSDSLTPEGTLLSYSGKFTTGKSLAGNESNYIKDTSFTSVFPDTNLFHTTPRLLASQRNMDANVGTGSKSATVKIDLATASSFISPIVPLTRMQLAMISNRIDLQTSGSATAGTNNAPLVYVAETDPQAGSHLAKHITRITSLPVGAIGLKVLLAANKPSACSFDVYYRTNSAGLITQANYTLLSPEVEMPSDDNPNAYRDYRYLAGGLTGTLDEFTEFQVKIVMKSTNSSKVPMFKDLRIIALND